MTNDFEFYYYFSESVFAYLMRFRRTTQWTSVVGCLSVFFFFIATHCNQNWFWSSILISIAFIDKLSLKNITPNRLLTTQWWSLTLSQSFKSMPISITAYIFMTLLYTCILYNVWLYVYNTLYYITCVKTFFVQNCGILCIENFQFILDINYLLLNQRCIRGNDKNALILKIWRTS